MAALLAACGGLPGTGDHAAELDQAHAALDRWAAAVAEAGGDPKVVPVGELTGQVGDWEPDVGSNNKIALMSGAFQVATTLPGSGPPVGDVQWADGTTTTVPLLSAQEAFLAMLTGPAGPCPDCQPIQLTGAVPATASIETTRGPATVPVWSFTIDGSAVNVTRVAIADPVTVVPPLWDPNHPPVGLAIDSAIGSASGTELTAVFVGAPKPGDQPCGEDYTAEAVESDLAVVIIVTRHANPTLGGCSAEGARRTATAELAAPLGKRAVLEVQQGMPVPVALAP